MNTNYCGVTPGGQQPCANGLHSVLNMHGCPSQCQGSCSGYHTPDSQLILHEHQIHTAHLQNNLLQSDSRTTKHANLGECKQNRPTKLRNQFPEWQTCPQRITYALLVLLEKREKPGSLTIV